MPTVTPLLIDCGHGGRDPGAVNQDTGLREKDVVLPIGLYLREWLAIYAPSLPVHMSRDDDTFLSLSARRDLADRLGADLLSIHANAGGGTGFEAFTWPGFSASDLWATTLLTGWDESNMAVSTLRPDFSDGDPDKEKKLAVLRNKKRGVLFEVGFVDRASDAEHLGDGAFQEDAGRCLAFFTAQHFGFEPQWEQITTDPLNPQRSLPGHAAPAPAAISNKVPASLAEEIADRLNKAQWQLDEIRKLL